MSARSVPVNDQAALDQFVDDVTRKLDLLMRGGNRGPNSSFGLPFRVGEFEFFQSDPDSLCVRHIPTGNVECFGGNSGIVQASVLATPWRSFSASQLKISLGFDSPNQPFTLYYGRYRLEGSTLWLDFAVRMHEDAINDDPLNATSLYNEFRVDIGVYRPKPPYDDSYSGEDIVQYVGEAFPSYSGSFVDDLFLSSQSRVHTQSGAGPGDFPSDALYLYTRNTTPPPVDALDNFVQMGPNSLAIIRCWMEVARVGGVIASDTGGGEIGGVSESSGGSGGGSGNVLPSGLVGFASSSRKTLPIVTGMPPTFDIDYGFSPFFDSQCTPTGTGAVLVTEASGDDPSGWIAAAGNTWSGDPGSPEDDPNDRGIAVGDYVQARILMPSGSALWPAFWLVDWEGGTPMEIDVMEMLGEDPTTIYHTNHEGGSETGQLTASAAEGVYHNFGAHLRGDGDVEFYIDGVSSGTLAYNMTEPTSGLWVCMVNLALSDGGWGVAPDGSTPLSSTMTVVEIARWRP